nr:hypothetical protein [Tanacetum cinerariifolium]
MLHHHLILCNDNYVLVEGLWIPNDVHLMWIIVYAPQNLSSKISLWSSLVNIIGDWDGNLVMMGDLMKFVKQMKGGFKFTWTDKWGTKMSKLDRFLVSKCFYDNFPHVTGVVLEKGIPDHRPILLKDFKEHDGIVEASGFISFKKKLQNLRRVIRDWVISKKADSNKLKREHQARLASVDAKVDQGCTNEEDFINHRDSTKIWMTSCCNSSFIALISKVPKANFVNDFRPISLIRCQYKIIGKLLANRLGSVIGSCISLEQSAFIKGRNILDEPLILNEVMAWYRKCKKELMVFKFDFKKAFDSLRWDYLDMIMGKRGFGHKWCFWIFGCLNSAHSSVLVNGSPTLEFDIYKGLRKGDPLSPFLFILALEGDWSYFNAHNLLCMLRCFYLISGLKINVNKSNILGVGVYEAILSNMAYSIGCGADRFFMKYLRVPVGGNMSLCSNWKAITQTFSSKLALWKARLLSIGGRLSLVKYVLGHLPTYYMSIYPMTSTIFKKLESMRNQFFLGGDNDERKMSWVRWNKCLASKDIGGLRIESISGLNTGLLFKWIWRFLCSPSTLWVRVIKSIHGPHGSINDTSPCRLSYNT